MAACFKPALAFPGHWAPMSLTFYTGTMFPEHYHNGAFIAPDPMGRPGDALNVPATVNCFAVREDWVHYENLSDARESTRRRPRSSRH